jgi:hypothetical protein
MIRSREGYGRRTVWSQSLVRSREDMAALALPTQLEGWSTRKATGMDDVRMSKEIGETRMIEGRHELETPVE